MLYYVNEIHNLSLTFNTIIIFAINCSFNQYLTIINHILFSTLLFNSFKIS